MTDTDFCLERYTRPPGNAVNFAMEVMYAPPGTTAPAVYAAKIHWEKVKRSFDRATPASRDRGVGGAYAQEAWHKRVLLVLDYAGIGVIDKINYIAYADALCYTVCSYEWLTDRIREHDIQRHNWESRGLRPDVLDMIDSLLPWRVGLT